MKRIAVLSAILVFAALAVFWDRIPVFWERLLQQIPGESSPAAVRPSDVELNKSLQSFNPESTIKPQLDTLPDGVSRMPFGSVAPVTGGLAVAESVNVAAHIDMSGDVVVWDPSDGKVLQAISETELSSKPAEQNQGKNRGSSAIALSADGELLAIGRYDSQVIIWSLQEHKAIRTFSGGQDRVNALAFSHNKRYVAGGFIERYVTGGLIFGVTQLWDLPTGARIHIFDAQFGGDIVGLGFSVDDVALFVNEWYTGQYEVDRRISIWDIGEGIEISTRDIAPPNRDNVTRVGQSIGYGGRLLTYTGMEGLAVERTDLCQPPLTTASGRYADTVTSDPLGRWVAAVKDDDLTFFGASDAKEAASTHLPRKIIALVPAADGRTIFALTEEDQEAEGAVASGVLYRIAVPESVWGMPPLVAKSALTHCPASDVARARQNFKIPARVPELRQIGEQAVSINVHKLLSWKSYYRFSSAGILEVQNPGEEPQEISITDPDTGETYRVAEDHFEHYDDAGTRLEAMKVDGLVMTFGARNGRLAALYRSGDVQVWDNQGHDEPRRYKLDVNLSDDWVESLLLSGDGRYVQLDILPSGDSDGQSLTYRLDTGRVVGESVFLTPFPLRANVVVVPDNRPHHLAVLDLEKGEIVARLPRHESVGQNGEYKPLVVAISEDGRQMASASYQGVIRVWDLGQQKLVGESHQGAIVTDMMFDPSGRQLVVRRGGDVVVLEIPAKN